MFRTTKNTGNAAAVAFKEIKTPYQLTSYANTTWQKYFDFG